MKRVTDPEILEQLEEDRPRKPVTDPLLLQALNRPPTGTEIAKDMASQAGYGLVRGATALPNLAYQGADYLSGGRLPSLESSPLYQEMHTPAETTAGRYTGAVAEGIGSLPTGAGAFGLASKLPLGAVSRFLGRAAAQPLSAVNLGAGAAGGAAVQGAEDLGYGPVAQAAAGLAGGVAGGLGVSGAARVAPRLLADEAGALRLPRRQPAPTPGAVDPRVEEQGFEMIADMARKAGLSSAQITERLERQAASRDFNTGSFAPDTMVMADVDPAFARGVGSGVRQYPEVANIVRPVVTARQTGITPPEGLPADIAERLSVRERMDPAAFGRDARPSGQHGRLVDAHRRALLIKDKDYHGHGQTAGETADMITAGQEAAAKPVYDIVRKAGEGLDVGAQPVVLAQVKKWQDLAAHADTPQAIRQTVNKALRQFAPSGKLAANIDDVDKAKRLVDDMIKPYFTGGDIRNKQLGDLLVQLKNDIIERGVDRIEAKGLGTKYARARSVFAGPAEAKRDIELGQKIYKGEADVGQFTGLTDPGARKRVRLGYHSAYELEAAGKTAAIDRTRMFASPKRERELALLVPRTQTPTGRVRVRGGEQAAYADRPQRLGEYVNWQEKEIATRDIVKGGSPTAERMADDAAFDTLHSLREVFSGSKSSMELLQRTARFALDTFGQRADVSAFVARQLFSPDPAVRARVARELQMRLGRSKYHRLAEIMDEIAEQQQRALAGQAGGLTGPMAEAAE